MSGQTSRLLNGDAPPAYEKPTYISQAQDTIQGFLGVFAHTVDSNPVVASICIHVHNIAMVFTWLTIGLLYINAVDTLADHHSFSMERTKVLDTIFGTQMSRRAVYLTFAITSSLYIIVHSIATSVKTAGLRNSFHNSTSFTTAIISILLAHSIGIAQTFSEKQVAAILITCVIAFGTAAINVLTILMFHTKFQNIHHMAYHQGHAEHAQSRSDQEKP
jgi:hypothetical protein